MPSLSRVIDTGSNHRHLIGYLEPSRKILISTTKNFKNIFLDEPSTEAIDGKAVDGIDSGIGESETLDDHNDEVETEDRDSMSGTEDSINPSLDQNPSIDSSTEQVGDSLKIDEDDQRDQLEDEVPQEVKEENSDGQNLEFKPESESGNFEH